MGLSVFGGSGSSGSSGSSGFVYDPVVLDHGVTSSQADDFKSAQEAFAAVAVKDAEEREAVLKAERKKMLLYAAAGFAVFVCILALIKRK